MSWFRELTGVDEKSPASVREQLSIDGDCLVCPGDKRIAFGRLETPTLKELRLAAQSLGKPIGRICVREVVGDVQQMHADAANANALFQVASQFNLLEMSGPSVIPERGVGIYEHDRTQGPACAIACGAGTIYRNYFAPVGNSMGQSASRQIDCAAQLGQRLGNVGGALWCMENGYLFPNDRGLKQITAHLQSASETELDQLRGELRIGLQWNAAVTLAGANHRVSQAYCSALPVSYGSQPTDDWADFAKLILDAAYEATICAAIINASQTGLNKIFLTLLGGGVFGNPEEWIISAIERAISLYHDDNLDIAIVSYGRSNPAVAELASRLA